MFTLITQGLDVDLEINSKDPNRTYPVPLTGHQIMALFPPAPPTMIEKQPGYTSNFFRREERAFFSRDSKVKVQREINLPQESNRNDGLKMGNSREPFVEHHGSGCQYPRIALPSEAPNPTPPHLDSERRASVIPILSSCQKSPITPPQFSYQHGQHMAPVDYAPANTGIKYHVERLTQDNPDEAWQRPMPHAERRRAGKYTKRNIIRT